MIKFPAVRKQFTPVLAALTLSFNGNSQTCPGFALGTPVTNLYTVDFYNNSGLLLTSCTCQLSSGTFKCGLCLPASWITYMYVSAGSTINCINPTILPVGLKAFDAIVSNGDVSLVWSTETERNNLEFIIERSQDAVEFTFFAKIAGAGNSNTPSNYSYSDTDPLRGISYYRISQRDTDGMITELGIVSMELSSAISGTVIAPNPSQGKTLLQLPLHPEKQLFHVTISDELGKIVRSFQTTEDTPLELTNGVYRVVVSSGLHTWSEKVVITD
ncbi:hypothetical protein D3C87_396260 [compost metagenome]